MTGSCLCGSIRWTTTSALRPVIECHCHRCQKATGNHMAATEAANEHLEITGDTITWYSPADDHNVAYGFCRACGSTLFYRSGIADATNSTTSICAGSIDGPSGLSTAEIWFASNAADHQHLPPGPATFPFRP